MGLRGLGEITFHYFKPVKIRGRWKWKSRWPVSTKSRPQPLRNWDPRDLLLILLRITIYDESKAYLFSRFLVYLCSCTN